MGFEHPKLREETEAISFGASDRDTRLMLPTHYALYQAHTKIAYANVKVDFASKKAASSRYHQRIRNDGIELGKESLSETMPSTTRIFLLNVLEIFVYLFGTLSITSVAGLVYFLEDRRADMVILSIFLTFFCLFLSRSASEIKKQSTKNARNRIVSVRLHLHQEKK